MFVIKIDYVVEFSCYVDGLMMWFKYVVNLVWFGFVDIYLEVNYYFVNVGFKYMGVDLNLVCYFLCNVLLNNCF